jgi:hypothetical protein|nr:MAG TPA: hypothetical protein [Caudoviricetes sp.]
MPKYTNKPNESKKKTDVKGIVQAGKRGTDTPSYGKPYAPVKK